MWVITVINNQDDIHIYEYETKSEALKAMENFGENAVLSYTE